MFSTWYLDRPKQCVCMNSLLLSTNALLVLPSLYFCFLYPYLFTQLIVFFLTPFPQKKLNYRLQSWNTEGCCSFIFAYTVRKVMWNRGKAGVPKFCRHFGRREIVTLHHDKKRQPFCDRIRCWLCSIFGTSKNATYIFEWVPQYICINIVYSYCSMHISMN